MDKQRQILEMAKDICRVKHICNDVCKPISACDALRYAERAVDAGYIKQEWISVDERLPKESGVYVAYTNNGNSMILDYSAKHKLFNSFDSYSRDTAEGFAIPVTHWMPLPQPPKENEND